jgi:branched-chain amino acid transport system substrate-binding protein
MNFRGFAAGLLAGAGAFGAFATGAAAQNDTVFKLAFVTFLSGPAAESAGKPSEQAARTVIDALNAGSLPKPYDKVGLGGLKIEVQFVDEAGGATKQVEELRGRRCRRYQPGLRLGPGFSRILLQ